MNQETREIQVFDLLETKNFHELSAAERSLVLELMNEEEYDLQRRIMLEAADVNTDVIAGPLVLPAEKKVLPIWIASACSAAAAAILVFLLLPSNDSLHIELKNGSIPMERDTLIVQNTVTDTIVDYVYVGVPQFNNEALAVKPAEPIPDYPTSEAFVPNLRENDLINEGISAANDAVVETFRSKPFIGM